MFRTSTRFNISDLLIKSTNQMKKTKKNPALISPKVAYFVIKILK